MDLMTKRSVIAEERWLSYDFGFSIEDSDGWVSSSDSDEITRTVYFTNDTDGPSIKGHFTVRFRPESIQVDEVYAMINGNIVGNNQSHPNTYDVTVYCVFKAKIENIPASNAIQAAVLAEEILYKSGALDQAEIIIKEAGDKNAGTYVSYIDFAEECPSFLVDVQGDVDYNESVTLKNTGDGPVHDNRAQ